MPESGVPVSFSVQLTTPEYWLQRTADTGVAPATGRGTWEVRSRSLTVGIIMTFVSGMT